MKKIIPYAFLFALLTGVLVGCSESSDSSLNNDVPEAPPCYVQLERNGEVYEEYAVQGQVWLLFDEDVPSDYAMQILAENKAKILDKEPEIGYYLVEVEAGTEGEFVARMSDYWAVDYVYPNALLPEQSVTPYAIDNFRRGTHGKRVVQMMEGAAMRPVKPIDDTFWIIEGLISQGKRNKGIISCLEYAAQENDVVINLSSGVMYISTNQDPKNDYINRYISDMVGLAKYAYRNHYWGDFVLVKSAGNESMKHLETILKRVQGILSPTECEFFRNHFMLVSAKDDYKPWDYPNDVYDGGYHEMVSKVDISDSTRKSADWCGTSFSAPRLAGYIVRAANQHDLGVSKVLPYVRRATKRSPNHVIDYQMIEDEITGKNVGDPRSDLVGQVVYDSSEDGYFPSDWRWTLREEDVISASEIERIEQTSYSVKTLVRAHLCRGLLKVDADMVLNYSQYGSEWRLCSLQVQSLTIPRQEDYSGYVTLNVDNDIFPSLVAYNSSGYTLFVGGDYTAGGETTRFGAIVEPYSSVSIAMLGAFTSYHVHFAYRK